MTRRLGWSARRVIYRACDARLCGADCHPAALATGCDDECLPRWRQRHCRPNRRGQPRLSWPQYRAALVAVRPRQMTGSPMGSIGRLSEGSRACSRLFCLGHGHGDCVDCRAPAADAAHSVSAARNQPLRLRSADGHVRNSVPAVFSARAPRPEQPRTGPGFFTVVAGTCVLGSEITILTGRAGVAHCALWVAGIALWVVVMLRVLHGDGGSRIETDPRMASTGRGSSASWRPRPCRSSELCFRARDRGRAGVVVLFFALCLYAGRRHALPDDHHADLLTVSRLSRSQWTR